MSEPEPVDYQDVAAQSAAQPGHRRRSKRRAPTREVRQRLRIAYFSLAALWGFLAGSGAVFVGLSSTGQPVPLGRFGVLAIVGAAVVALLGAFVAAAAYRAASQRYR